MYVCKSASHSRSVEALAACMPAGKHRQQQAGERSGSLPDWTRPASVVATARSQWSGLRRLGGALDPRKLRVRFDDVARRLYARLRELWRQGVIAMLYTLVRHSAEGATHRGCAFMMLDILARRASQWSRSAARRVVRLHLMQHGDNIARHLALAHRPRIDLGAKEQDQAEIVEEQQDHQRKARARSIVMGVQKGRDVDREDDLVDDQHARRDQRPTPDFVYA